ncbi:BTB domain-containing protein [Madurella fahalii]|uniref:BTB domain-containing protein n=1 Tax=Madurella fahalii TaxID=1157608 RepID=A0ABQ0GHE2_9PEZI
MSNADIDEPITPLAKRRELASDAQIRILAGGRLFVTTKETLTEESAFFASLLSGRWDNAQEDGSYFIDTDPILFEHILRYLRRGVFPLFFDATKGHDYHLYLSLLEEARYFQIPRLEDWLQKKRYLDAVRADITAEQHDDNPSFWHERLTVPVDATMEYYPSWGTKKVYICPRGIFQHRGRPEACGRRCETARGESSDKFEEEPCLRVLTTKRVIVFDPDICVARSCEAKEEKKVSIW